MKMLADIIESLIGALSLYYSKNIMMKFLNY